MQKRTLTREKIIEASFLLGDEIGIDKLTFQKIALALNIKYPSLYNHFSNMDELKTEMSKYIFKKLNFTLIKRLVGKSGATAIREFAVVYREFAIENKSAYSLFMNFPSTEDEEVYNLGKECSNIIRQILNFYIKDKTMLIHKSRYLRSLLHGFVSMSFLGYFQGDANLDESFNLMIDDFIKSISID